MSIIRTPKEEGHYTIKRVKRLPKRGNYNFLYALRTTDLDRLYRWTQEAKYEEILLGGGGITEVIAGTDVTIDNSDPKKPIVNISGVFLNSIVAGTDVVIDSTDPNNPIINFNGSTFEAVIAGNEIIIDNTDPDNPIVSTTENSLLAVTGGANVTIDNTNPRIPIVNALSGITSLQAGTNVTIDATNPNSPIISATGGSGGLNSIVGGTDVSVDITDPLNPIVNSTVTVPTQTSDLTNNGSDNTSTYVENDELATVATTGDYEDLINLPTIPTPGILTIVAGSNITVDNTNPLNPIVSGSGGSGGITSIVGGTNVNVNNTDPLNPIISASFSGFVDLTTVQSVGGMKSFTSLLRASNSIWVSGGKSDIEFANSSNNNSLSPSGLTIYSRNGALGWSKPDLTPSNRRAVFDNENSIERTYLFQNKSGTVAHLDDITGGLSSVVAGTNISVDITDPDNPIVNADNTNLNYDSGSRVITSSTGNTITIPEAGAVAGLVRFSKFTLSSFTAPNMTIGAATGFMKRTTMGIEHTQQINVLLTNVNSTISSSTPSLGFSFTGGSFVNTPEFLSGIGVGAVQYSGIVGNFKDLIVTTSGNSQFRLYAIDIATGALYDFNNATFTNAVIKFALIV